ncbi:MAG TPA: LysR substrate-binding domain-containing protein, partial [Stellaceae bacterium]
LRGPDGELADTRRAVADDGAPNGPLVIGSLETTAGLRLSSVLAGYAETYPGVDLELTTGTTCGLVDAVLAHRLEGAFVCGPAHHPELDEEVVFVSGGASNRNRPLGASARRNSRPKRGEDHRVSGWLL